MRLEKKIYDATSTPLTLPKRRSFHEITQFHALFCLFSANASVSPNDTFVIIWRSYLAPQWLTCRFLLRVEFMTEYDRAVRL